MLHAKSFLQKYTGGPVPPVLLVLVICAVALGCERRDISADRTGPGPAVAMVNGRPMNKRDFDSYIPEDYRDILTSAERKGYLDRWIATELLYDEALKRGIKVTPEIEARLEQLKKDLVADRLVQEVISREAVVGDDEVRAYYEARIDQYTQEYRVSHILVNTLEDIDEIKQELQKRSFSWVATRKSVDRHTGPGGDLGFLSKGNMLPGFEEVVFNMKVGEVSDVIESEVGYHFIKLTDVREAHSNRLDYDEAAEGISRELLLEKRAAVYDNLIRSLIEAADIEILDPDLKLIAELPDTAVTN